MGDPPIDAINRVHAEKGGDPVDTPIYRRPGPAVVLALAAGFAAHAANVNAANALGASSTAIAIAVGLLLMLFGWIASGR